MKQTSALVFFFLLNTLCCKKDSIEGKPENHNPVIFSLSVFPEVVGPSDSVVVICYADDPDGDTLVYDWYTTGVVRIKGAHLNDPFLFHTIENARVFYAPDSLHVAFPRDTFWVECGVRDRVGGLSAKTVHFAVASEPR